MTVNTTGGVRATPEVEQFILNSVPAESREAVQQLLQGQAQLANDPNAPFQNRATVDTRNRRLGDETDAIRERRLAAESTFVQQLAQVMPGALDRLADLSRSVSRLTSSASGLTAANGNILATKAGGELQAQWGAFIADAKARYGGAFDVNALVQSVLRESYLQTTEDLYFYAEKVKFFNEIKKAIRQELTDARKRLADVAGAEDKASLSPPWPGKGISSDFTGSAGKPGMDAALYKDGAIDTKGKLDAYIKGLEEKLSSVGDDAQLANVDLQNVLQKQQQTIQMLSNISKMLHDTAMAIVRKIGG
jgi:hypothetical protein